MEYENIELYNKLYNFHFILIMRVVSHYMQLQN